MSLNKEFKPVINKTWLFIFEEIDKDIWDITQEEYNKLVNSNKTIFPIYSNIFNFTNFLIPSDIKICIIGQDPYHGIFKDSNTNIYYPEAMGLSFSVPKKSHIPSSLQNIYKNLSKHGHIVKNPSHGDLSYWAYQGILFLNSALCVEKSKPNSCQTVWSDFTNELVRIISTKYSGIIFLLWGKHAHLKKLDGIIGNQSSHKFIISSHPSGFSANSPYREFKSFMDTDHFGLANQYLIEQNKSQIDWQII
jgi:uracil-DNA glycosylase